MYQSSRNIEQEIKKLIELNDELENYFRNTIIPQLFVDANLILRKFSPPVIKQFNLTEKDKGTPMQEISDNFRFPTLMEDIKSVIKSNNILEKEIQTTDSRWYQMNILPYIVRKENKTNGVIITFIDITERIKTLKEIQKLNADHDTFIYSVSHDLKAPLTNIEGLIKNLNEGIEEGNKEEVNTIVEMLNLSVENMREIINELTDITRIEADTSDDVEKVKFEDILEEVQLTIKEKINETHAHIKTDLKEHEISFSRKNLRSIVYNLLSNAIKYKSPDRSPELLIKTERSDGCLLLSVKDNGLGIEEDKKGKIFSQFTRFKKDVEGTGVGLFLVKKIVDNNGGKIKVESEVGKGSTFKVYLKPL
jgi:two-component system, OmpR family, phosphate regulon sensor histidine kinase PhoR